MRKWILNQFWIWVPFYAEKSRNTCGLGIDFERYKVPAFKNFIYQKCRVIGTEHWQDRKWLVKRWLAETKNEYKQK